MSTSFKKEINAVSHNFAKIIFGTSGLRKPDKVASSFHIPSSETIIAYIKSAIPFMGPVIVITDGAIYTFLGDPVPIAEVCGYLVTMTDAKACVHLSDSKDGRDILGGSIIAKNTAGAELVQFIRDLQGVLLQTYPWAKQQRDALADKIVAAARSEMKTGRISAERIFQLDTLSAESAYCDSVALLKGEDIFRSCNYADYRAYVSQQANKISNAAKMALTAGQETFSAALLQDLEDISLDFSHDYLETAYRNMSSLTSYTDSQCLVLAYLCARLDKTDPFQTVREQVSLRCGEDKAQNLDFFKGRYFNYRMKKVYEMVKQGTMPPDEYLDWTDSIGLTALHYAIVLNQDQLVENLLDKKRWEPKAPVSNSEAEQLYDYTVLACYRNLPNRRSIFQKTADVIAAQLRSRKALERRLWLKQRKLDIQNASAKKAKEIIHTARKNGLYDKEAEFQEKLATVSALRDETNEEIEEINQAISDIDYEIEDMTNDAVVGAADTIQRLQHSSDPLVQYLFRLFSDADTLFHVLCSQQGEFRLYNCDGFKFVTPADVHMDLPYIASQKEDTTSAHQENCQKQGPKKEASKQAPITKPYGTSWFSPDAHRDMEKLKEEYRTLAKEYHPDVCSHTRSKEAFQEILNERADILERMSDMS